MRPFVECIAFEGNRPVRCERVYSPRAASALVAKYADFVRTRTVDGCLTITTEVAIPLVMTRAQLLAMDAANVGRP